MGDYREIPGNWSEIQPHVRMDTEEFVKEVLARRKCFFYDTCSFRRHAGLGEAYAECVLAYIKAQNGMIVLTRCILMELASHSGILKREYIEYCRRIKDAGIPIFVIYEEAVSSVMEICFGTNAKVNSLLSWAVRMLKSPVSTITRVLEEDRVLWEEVVCGKNRDRSGMYHRFFPRVREKKEPQDNLGEELLAICLHILSQLPGEEDGKFCIITDDKGAAGKIDALFRRTNSGFRGKKIILFSTPKLVQRMYEDGFIEDRDAIQVFLETGIGGNIVVLGTRIFDLRSNEISLSCEELAGLIVGKEIHITF